jgi:large subunit ribosomal protein L24
MKIKKGDTVMVLSGKEKGKTGTVQKVLKDKDMVLVEGVNPVTRHQKSRRTRSRGQVIEKHMPVPAAKVGVVVDGKPVRVGYQFEGEGDKRTKVRVARPNGKKIA